MATKEELKEFMLWAQANPDLAEQLRGSQSGSGMLSTGQGGTGDYSLGAAKYSPTTVHFGPGGTTRTGGELIREGGVVFTGDDPTQDTAENRAIWEQSITQNNPYLSGPANFVEDAYVPSMLTESPVQTTAKTTAAPVQAPVQGPTDAENRAQFFDGVLEKYWNGTLTPEQIAGVDPRNLSAEEGRTWASTQRAMSGLEGITSTGKMTQETVGEFMIGMRNLEQHSPEQFQRLIQTNPELGVKYFASLATGRYFVNQDIDTKAANEQAQRIGYQMGVDAGYGEDGVRDGKSFVSGYGTNWGDVNNEGGAGDFQKLGRPGAMKGGFMDFVEDNPLAVAATLATTLVPMAAPAVAGALGVSAPVAGAILSSGLQIAQGGSLEDVLLAGATQYGLTSIANNMPTILENISPEVAQAFAESQGFENVTQAVVEQGDNVHQPGLFSVAGSLNDQYSDYGDVTIAHQPGATSDQIGDVNINIPDYSLPQSDGGGGGEESAPAAEVEEVTEVADGGGRPDTEWVDVNHEARDDESWRHTNPDGQVVAGNEMGEVWEVEPAEEIEDPNWSGVLSGIWGDGGDIGTGGTDGTSTGGSGSSLTLGGSGGAGDTTGGGESTGDGDGEGDGSDDGDGELADMGEDAEAVLNGTASKAEYKDFMYRVKTEFPMLEKIPPLDLLRIFAETV